MEFWTALIISVSCVCGMLNMYLLCIIYAEVSSWREEWKQCDANFLKYERGKR